MAVILNLVPFVLTAVLFQLFRVVQRVTER